MATGTLVGLGLGALALSAGATVASGVMGKQSQEEANATNIQLSREANSVLPCSVNNAAKR